MGLNDPTGFGEQGFLVNYWENSVAYPVWETLKISDEKRTGIAVLHDSNEGHTTYTNPDNKEVKQKVDAFKSYLKNEDGAPKTLPQVTSMNETIFNGNENRIIYNGKLHSHIDGKLLWDFRINPVNVFGYIEENQFAILDLFHTIVCVRTSKE